MTWPVRAPTGRLQAARRRTPQGRRARTSTTGRRWLVWSESPVGPGHPAPPTWVGGHSTRSRPSGPLCRATSRPRTSPRQMTFGPGLAWLVVGAPGGGARRDGRSRVTSRRRRLTIRPSRACLANQGPSRRCCSTKRAPVRAGAGRRPSPAGPAVRQTILVGSRAQYQRPTSEPPKGRPTKTRPSPPRTTTRRPAPGASALVVSRPPPLPSWRRAIAARTWACGWPPDWGPSS